MNIFRIIPFERLLDMLDEKQMVFTKPSEWDDPGEFSHELQIPMGVYAQCWSARARSDAMWKIYSQNKLGVRIGTTRTRLESACVALTENNWKWCLKEVKYISESSARHARARFLSRKGRLSPVRAYVQQLEKKRRAFDYEHEVRLVVYRENQNSDPKRLKNYFPLDFITSVQFDPRLDRRLVSALSEHLDRQRRGLKFRITRCDLYDR